MSLRALPNFRRVVAHLVWAVLLSAWSPPVWAALVEAPRIVSQSGNVSLIVGDAMELSVVCTGSDPISYRWFKNGVPIDTAVYPSHFVPFVDSTSLSGTYQLVAQNTAGSVSSAPIVVSVEPAQITEAPASISVPIGQSVTLSGAVRTNFAASYQWLKDDVVIDGANALSYSFPVAGAANTGSYRLRVSNFAGVIDSTAAAVTLQQAITFPGIDDQTYPGSGVALRAVASSGLAVVYSVVSGPGTIANGVLTPTGAGTVVVRASQPGDARYGAASPVERSLVVGKGTPTLIRLPAGSDFTYGQRLIASNLVGGAANVPGAFAYAYPQFQPRPGTSAQTVVFTPSDSQNYHPLSVDILIWVSKATPSILRSPTAGSLSYGQSLASTTLAGGVATVPGTFAFDAPSSTPEVGTRSQTVRFTPTDSANYRVVNVSVEVTVIKATPSVSALPTAAELAMGQSLADATLTGGSASVPGSFLFTTPSLVPPLGTALRGVEFVPTDAARYNRVALDVPVTVRRATPVIRWSVPSAISYGTPLSAKQLNASSDASGTFTYEPKEGTVLEAGEHLLTVTFAPADTERYVSQTATVAFQVLKATPEIIWPEPRPMTYGTALSSVQLNASTPVPGRFVYVPATGTRLGSGTALLSATFVPDDPKNVASPTVTTPLVVNRAELTVRANDAVKVAGEPNPPFGFSISGFVDGESAAVISGAAALTTSAVAESPSGTYPIAVAVGSLRAENYVFSRFVPGSLVVSEANRLLNFSVRATISARSGQDLISGFVIGGTTTKQVLLRAIGPTLGAFGVGDALPDPSLVLYDAAGRRIATNADWADPAVSTVGALTGAFAIPVGSRDAAIVAQLAPGAYTVQVTGGSGEGVVLTELYDASGVMLNPADRVRNVSARGPAGPGGQQLIAGFVVAGSGARRILIRGVGPTLAALGVAGALADPRLAVLHGDKVLGDNDQWSENAGIAAELAAAARSVGAFALPPGSRDAAIILNLPPGAYTVHLTPSDQTSRGVALIEVYEIP